MLNVKQRIPLTTYQKSDTSQRVYWEINNCVNLKSRYQRCPTRNSPRAEHRKPFWIWYGCFSSSKTRNCSRQSRPILLDLTGTWSPFLQIQTHLRLMLSNVYQNYILQLSSGLFWLLNLTFQLIFPTKSFQSATSPHRGLLLNRRLIDGRETLLCITWNLRTLLSINRMGKDSNLALQRRFSVFKIRRGETLILLSERCPTMKESFSWTTNLIEKIERTWRNNGWVEKSRWRWCINLEVGGLIYRNKMSSNGIIEANWFLFDSSRDIGARSAAIGNIPGCHK
jgi:hypothetical protein